MKSERSSKVKGLAIIAVILSFLSVSTNSIEVYNQGVREEQNLLLKEDRKEAARKRGEVTFDVYILYSDNRPFMRLGLLVLTFVGAIAILMKAYSKLAIALTSTSVFIYVFWSLSIFSELNSDWDIFRHSSIFEVISQAANPFDYLLFLTLIIILMMQIYRYCYIQNLSSVITEKLP